MIVPKIMAIFIFTNSFSDLETLVVSHPQDLQKLFNPKNKILDAPGAANKIFEPQLGENSLIVQDGERHLRQRKLIMPPFHGEQMLTYGQQICEITQQIIQHIQSGETFIARELSEDITMKIILKVIFGLDEGLRFEKLKNLMTTWLGLTSSPLSASVLLFPALQKDLGAWSPWGKYLRLRQQIDEKLTAEISERRQQEYSSRSDILSLLIAAEYEDGEAMSDAELRDYLLTLLNLYPQPDKFQPERFINRKYSSYEFLPFGAGSRQCLGQVFALFEMKLILGTILLNYQLKLEEKAPVTPARRGFLMGPHGGVKMRIAANSSMVRINR